MFDVVGMANVPGKPGDNFLKFLVRSPLLWGLNSGIKACTAGTFTHRAFLLALSLNLWMSLSQ